MSYSDLPVQGSDMNKAIQWFKDNFSLRTSEALKGTPFTLDVITSIFLQETAYIVVNWIGKYSTSEILKYSIFDASGDLNGDRGAFPKNSQDFINKFGQAYYDKLVALSNKMRGMRGMAPKNILYNGYGIFQNDLQNILTDKEFWDNEEWQYFDNTLSYALGELNRKYKIAGDVPTAIRMYNGAGRSAEQYKDNVELFIDYSQKIQPNIHYQASSIFSPDIQPVQKLIGVKPDGYFGKMTEASLIDYQSKNNLPQNGVIDFNFARHTGLLS